MKKLSKIAAVAMFGIAALASNVVNAASPATGTFNVNINLTASCSIGTIPDVTLAYTSFGGAVSAPTTANVKCTNLLPYALSLSPAPATDDVVNIAYTTALTGTVPTAGSGGDQPVTITVSAIAGQAGTCSTIGGICNNTTATNKVQTLTVSW